MSKGMHAESQQVEPNSELLSFVGELASGTRVPMPEDEPWSATIERISVDGRVIQVNRETYWHFVEVLPPRFLLGCLFAFAEGMAPLRLFWRQADDYFCRQLSWSESRQFCRLAGLPQDYWAY